MIEINTCVCDACGTCVAVCPSDALVLEQTLSIKSDACSMCCICVRVCPFGALSITPVASRECVS
jgi:ferredoxin